MQDCSLNLPRARAHSRQRAWPRGAGRGGPGGGAGRARSAHAPALCQSGVARYLGSSAEERAGASQARRAARADQAANQVDRSTACSCGARLVPHVAAKQQRSTRPHRRMASMMAGPSESPAAFAAPPAPHALPGAASRARSLRAHASCEPTSAHRSLTQTPHNASRARPHVPARHRAPTTAARLAASRTGCVSDQPAAQKN